MTSLLAELHEREPQLLIAHDGTDARQAGRAPGMAERGATAYGLKAERQGAGRTLTDVPASLPLLAGKALRCVRVPPLRFSSWIDLP